MRLTLWYVVPGGKPVAAHPNIDTSMLGYDLWLQSLIKPLSDTIFFYTTDTTDIF